MEFPKYIRETLIPGLVSQGKFDKEVPGDEEVILDDIRAKAAGGLGEDHWASSTYFVEIDIRRGSKTKSLSLVVKFVCPGEGFKDVCLTDEMAKNEGRMYNSILAYFDEMWNKKFGEELTIYPKCYCAQLTDPILVVMQNLGSLGFRLTTERTFLDKHHLLVAMEKIAQFHGLSYAAKALDSETFLPLAHQLRETHYVPEKQQGQSGFLSFTVLRGIKGLENEPFSAEEKAVFDEIKARLADPFAIMAAAANAERGPGADALAVVCHGDFLRNNMLFKYDETGKAVDVRFFDFQTSRYATPALDLALYVFMNTTREIRSTSWDEIFKLYHDTLVKTVKRLGATEKDVPTLDAIKKDFVRHALSGYVVCSFFLPIMMAPPDASRFDGSQSEGLREEVAQEMAFIAGEEGTHKLEDVIRDIVKITVKTH